jgi:hypothetical protein
LKPAKKDTAPRILTAGGAGGAVAVPAPAAVAAAAS